MWSRPPDMYNVQSVHELYYMLGYFNKIKIFTYIPTAHYDASAK